MKNSIKRPRLRFRDRLFCILLPRAWAEWRCLLVIVKPATVIAWHGKDSGSSENKKAGREVLAVRG
jgi:hypothetical protein